MDSSSNETTITGATAATYTLVTADVDHTIEVQVSFTDDDDNPEGPITSDTFPSSGTVVAATATACPTGYDWCSELTVGTFVDTDKSLTLYGYIADATTTGALADTSDTTYGVTYTVTKIIIMVPDGTPSAHSVLVQLDKLVPRGTVFNLGGMEFTTDEASENATSNSYLWTAPTSFSWTDGQKVTVSAEGPANSVATGAPTISGAPQVGETLTAGTSGITDANGLTDATFVYQWIRVDSDGTSKAEDIGTDSSTYVVVAADLGKKIKVEVSSTDDDDNVEEPLESDAYPVSGTVVATKTDCPTVNDWCTQITSGYTALMPPPASSEEFGYSVSQNYGAIGDDNFTHDATDTDYVVTELYVDKFTDIGTVTSHGLNIIVTGGTLPDGTVINVGGTQFTVGTDIETTTTGEERWDLLALGISLPDWVVDQFVTVSLTFPVASTDATLSGLTLEDADDNSISLIPAFASDTTSYTAEVAANINQTTFDATASDSSATVALTPADADTMEDDHQVNLAYGENTLTAEVTAEDDSTQTYTVTVTRTLPVVEFHANSQSHLPNEAIGMIVSGGAKVGHVGG